MPSPEEVEAEKAEFPDKNKYPATAEIFTPGSLLASSPASLFPFLLQDNENINTVMEFTELSISGSISKNKTSDAPLFKVD